MLRLYNTVLLPLRAGVELWAAWASRHPARRREWGERLGRVLPTASAGGVWVHGASVGEARIVGELASGLRTARPGLPVAVSAYTTAGREQLPGPPSVDSAFFVPLDFPGFAMQVLRALQPSALVLVETELWPNLLQQAHSASVPVVILNGRLSPRRMSRYRRLSALYRPLLARVARVGAQSSEDAARWIDLGAPADGVIVTGNVKYDLASPEVDEATLRQRLRLSAERPVLVAGSTAPGEEGQVLEAFQAVRREHADLLLVLAPRHVERADEAAALVREHGLRCRRYSADDGGGEAPVLLLDTVGDLAALYRLARVAFVGGSLVPVGGHNVLEPAAVGVPVLFGPHTEHFREPAEALERAGGALRVTDAAGLARAVDRLVRDPARRDEMGDRARRVVEVNRGALARSVGLLLEVLDRPGAPTARTDAS
jgi:3-deoxy-D-manno-octulosonic-acid transferase